MLLNAESVSTRIAPEGTPGLTGRLFNNPAQEHYGAILIGADGSHIGLATRPRLLDERSCGLRHCPGCSIHKMRLDVAMAERFFGVPSGLPVMAQGRQARPASGIRFTAAGIEPNCFVKIAPGKVARPRHQVSPAAAQVQHAVPGPSRSAPP